MDQSEKKIPVEMQTPVEKTTKGKSLALLAGAVALLAISFVVVVVVTAWSLNKDKTCQTTSSVPTEKETYHKEINVGEDVLEETIVTIPEAKKEYIVARNKTNGLVSSVTTVDYQQNQTTMYTTRGNMCLVALGHLNYFEETEEGFKSQKDYPSTEISFSIGGLAGDRVDIPVEMSPYCTIGNTYLLVAKNNGERGKRQVGCCDGATSTCPWCCEYLFGPIGIYQGYYVYYYACWISDSWRCPLCNGTDYNEYYVWK